MLKLLLILFIYCCIGGVVISIINKIIMGNKDESTYQDDNDFLVILFWPFILFLFFIALGISKLLSYPAMWGDKIVDWMVKLINDKERDSNETER